MIFNYSENPDVRIIFKRIKFMDTLNPPVFAEGLFIKELIFYTF